MIHSNFKRLGISIQKIIGKSVLYLVTGITSVLFVLPVFMVLNYSFKTKRELVVGNPLKLPETLQWDNYSYAFYRLDMLRSFTNTAFYTSVSVFIIAIVAGAAAWAIARNRGRFFKFSYIYFLIGILIPYQALFLPIYIIGYTMNLTNNAYGIIIMYVATGLSFGVFLMTSFMNTVPVELEEASFLDGCSIYRTYFSVVLPLLKPAVATLIIMQAFQIWNDYLLASLFVSKRSLTTLNVVLQSLFSQQSSDYSSAMAAIIISISPITILYISVQKYFIQGLTAGAVKG
ncbi:carbohydrate ABC transporter permease [Oceanispirochaeta sp.]|jgi:raffinose/stachyose/melibiose transport system permease protein|uniref:carbohydrate ABC transporter permease n=1 Tax=Oceanispirochaeta sp. TaxID=2035350 RepID=UPI00261408E4|nr:carbohydrate ABC transporter permease [Oceanispirochaeta sp.]MDA3957577.1 carbohydrate ABC transporter permease [Oceanispirochaeta sp.]